MKLGIFAVAGAALNFGARRMETIMRVAWLPVSLLLIVNMATVFAYLSVIAGRQITFTEAITFARAEQTAALYMARGWENAPVSMGIVTGVSILLQMILVSSFMAPLIRLAGLGERPAPGVVRMPFGPDQIRFILAGAFSFVIMALLVLAPASAAAYYSANYIVEALSQTVASFPNPESLHTIELTTLQTALAKKGDTWLYDYAIPIAIALPFLGFMWLTLMAHFHPRNRRNPGPANVAIRAVWVGVIVLAFAAFLFYGLQRLAGQAPATGAGVSFVVTVLAGLFYTYVNTRLAPYTGVAVCRKSMAPGRVFRVSRGWNLLRLWVALALVGLLLAVAQVLINRFALGWISSGVVIIYQAAAAYTKLLNSGVTGEWVTPTFIWIWNSIKILVNVFWAFFSYGVAAGLYGRLYRESEREEDPLMRAAAGDRDAASLALV
ncbi:MAG: hypothetical protein AAGA09_00805 [Pseudomonadota bacterium]